MKPVLRLGSRRSLLAWAQSSWVAREFEKINPNYQVELVGIETRGDQIQHISLQKVEGKDFFVAELDRALQAGSVDFTVHSLKDLSLARPADLICAAVPVRRNPRDVVLFGPRVLDKLKAGKSLRIGTSSPRRLENLPDFLSRALPHRPELEWKEIRGNVNSRLGRVHEAESSPKYLDGVVLAFAGLIRLWEDDAGRQELTRLLKGVRWMVLPLSASPTAPGQGALAIECRRKDIRLFEALRKLHSIESEKAVSMERDLLKEWGGGCHFKFGATSIEHPELGTLFYTRGTRPDGVFIKNLKWKQPAPGVPGDSLRPWDGTQNKPEGRVSELKTLVPRFKPREAVFVAHSNAAYGKWMEALQSCRVWVSGTASWFNLADKGIWVEGCGENLGFQFLRPIIGEKILDLPSLSEWQVLTHQSASFEWESQGTSVLPNYNVNLNYGNEMKKSLETATHVFWSSGSQFVELKEYVSKEAHQACGPGKTADRMRKAGLTPAIFPSAEEWRKWLNIQT